MKRVSEVLLVLAACGLVWFGIASLKRRESGSARAARVKASASARSAVSERALVAHLDGPRISHPDEFNKRFRLSEVEAMDFWSEMGALRAELMEQKGSKAQILEYDGHGQLKMFIPALFIPMDQLEAAILTHLRKALGEKKADLIWADSAGRELLLHRSWDDSLKCDVTYTFTKIRDENNPAANGSLGDAAFDFEVVFDPGNSGAKEYPNDDLITVEGFSYTRAGVYDFGWNAMAKAPAGYFRSEPILGVASRPPPSVTAIVNLDNDSVEIRNRRYPGSKEVVVHGGEVEGREDKPGTK